MAGSDGSFQRPPTAQEAVLAELRNWILTGRLEPGNPIRQDAIATELGVSRVPVREALKMLEGEGHVTYRPHRGYFVAQLDLEELMEIYHIRRLLEGEALRLCAENLTPEVLRVMETAMQELEEASDREDLLGMIAANRRFHFTPFEAAGMPRLQHLIRVLWDASEPYRSVYYFVDPEHRRLVQDEHRQILDALVAGNIEAAISYHNSHRENAIAALGEVLEPASSNADRMPSEVAARVSPD